jgi:hypothetical protein
MDRSAIGRSSNSYRDMLVLWSAGGAGFPEAPFVSDFFAREAVDMLLSVFIAVVVFDIFGEKAVVFFSCLAKMASSVFLSKICRKN